MPLVVGDPTVVAVVIAAETGRAVGDGRRAFSGAVTAGSVDRPGRAVGGRGPPRRPPCAPRSALRIQYDGADLDHPVPPYVAASVADVRQISVARPVLRAAPLRATPPLLSQSHLEPPHAIAHHSTF